MSRFTTATRNAALALALSVSIVPATADAQGGRTGGRGAGGPQQVVPLDTTRVRQLYVSNRWEDHPVSNYENAIRGKASTDSIFAARAKGVMDYRKIKYRSRIRSCSISRWTGSRCAPSCS